MRKIKFVSGEYYHVYNRGVDKRNIFNDKYDVERFFQCMDEFNTIKPIGSLYENSFLAPHQQVKRKSKKLVNFITYCLNSNHFHFILEPISENGISKFMHRLSTGYSWYFNNKNQRSGSLFQGPFKATHIDSNEYLLRVSVYVNLNFKVHQLGGLAAKLVKSSWEEYIFGQTDQFCKKNVILRQFNSKREYGSFALETLPEIIERKKREKEVSDLLIEN
ncbi:transposase [Candidatus Giovannonibacteria bacterium]|nr:transposase [Candidatus Giovannonibacteria bacterium]